MRMQQTCGQIGKPHSSKHEQRLQPRGRARRSVRPSVMVFVMFRGVAFMILMRLMGITKAGMIV